jgi:hypothetical protein
MTLLHRLEILFAVSIFLSLFNWGKKILFPFQLFTTWIHECGHAFTATVLGGSAIRITLAADGSGLTHYQIAPGKIRQGVIASAGYVGASFCGCSLFALAVLADRSSRFWNTHSLVILFSALIALSLLFWIRNGFGFLSVAILGVALMSLNYRPLDRYASSIFLFLAMQTALNSLLDIRVLFGLGSRKNTSDAHTLQKIFWLPYWFWALVWLGESVAMMAFTLRILF